ncbi:unnamed protein product [Adineta steineri]|uniref:Ribosome assembly protein 1 n=2 Tax=Adineta steineri TaxID=433720 RepID=A0A818TVG5_9BILA|nr:unnamed protein product [Adineta steineri]
MPPTITYHSEILCELQENTESIRNICILAHVDHGKTTLADDLLASNGIISTRLAGKLRLMDSLEAEQIRGITMKSSAVSLVHEKDNKKYLINLIDTPGHVDFSSEVSTAVRLCDGAIILIDVVEGVCPQTLAALRQAWLENLRIILVLNKIDRLIIGLKMSPLEAYLHIRAILEHLNAVVAEQFASLLLEKCGEQEVPEEAKNENNEDDDDDWAKNESRICFSPQNNNVLFASALDGWAFGIHHFADIYAKKLSLKREVLMKTLWGDFYFDKKTKRVHKGAQSKGQKPMFVQFILENIWSVYDAIIIRRDNDKLEKIATSIGAKLTPRDIKHTDPMVPLQLLFNQWLPVASAVFDMVVVELPHPKALNTEKIEQLMCNKNRRFDTLLPETQQLKQAFVNCSSDDQEPVIIYVSKLFSVHSSALSQNRHKPLTTEDIAQRREFLKQKQLDKTTTNEESTNQSVENGHAITENIVVNATKTESNEPADENAFLAFARVFSGRIKRGQKVFVLGPRHDPALFVGKDLNEMSAHSISHHVHEFIVQDLYLMMGREFTVLDQVPAGNIVAIGQLDSLVLKSATLSTNIFCPSFTGLHFETSPIVRVAIEAKNPSQMKQLRRGMRLLNQADPLVECTLKDTGEYILSTAGEVHLQRCIDDLTKIYGRVEVNVSAPIIPFRETIIPPPKVDFLNEALAGQQQQFKSNRITKERPAWLLEDGLVELSTQNHQCTFHLRAVPLPDSVTRLLDENASLLAIIEQVQGRDDRKVTVELNDQTLNQIRQLRERLNEEFIAANGNMWNSDTVDEIWSFGPHRCGTNLLLGRIPNSIYKQRHTSIWTTALNNQTKSNTNSSSSKDDYDLSIVSGFQLATAKGSLCDEPLMGVGFIIERWTLDTIINNDEEQETLENNDVDSSTAATTTMINPIDEVESVLETLSIISDESSALNTQEKPRRVIDKSKIVIKRGPLSGQIVSTIRDGCRKAFDSQPRRLVAAMYKCELMVNAEALGRAYSVLNKRNGRVLNEDMKEGTSTFIIQAALPVAESFGFAEEMRKKASGLASPQLSGKTYWEIIELDPFWEPQTEEEFLHFGEKADFENRAKKYMNDVRRRKVSRKVVHIGGGTLYLALYFYNDNGYLSKYLNIFPYALWTVILLWKSQQKSFDNRQHDLVIDIMTRHRHQYELIRGPLFFNFVIIICGTVLYRTVLGSMIMAILTWGDGLAAVIGMRYGYKRKIYGSKSLDGFLTVFIVGIIASVTYISLVVGFQSMLQPLKHILQQKRIILASSSPQRKQLLQSIGLQFDIIVSDFAEDLDLTSYKENLSQYVIDTAEHKCRLVYNQLKLNENEKNNLIIIGADTMCLQNNIAYGKPSDKDDAFRMLKAFSNNTHQVCTGVCILQGDMTMRTFSETTDVIFGAIDDETIRAYVETGEPMNKAGSYGIQSLGATLVKKIDGDYFNVVGFPIYHFCIELKALLNAEIK